jgi:hypothetical protein
MCACWLLNQCTLSRWPSRKHRPSPLFDGLMCRTVTSLLYCCLPTVPYRAVLLRAVLCCACFAAFCLPLDIVSQVVLNSAFFCVHVGAVLCQVSSAGYVWERQKGSYSRIKVSSKGLDVVPVGCVGCSLMCARWGSALPGEQAGMTPQQCPAQQHKTAEWCAGSCTVVRGRGDNGVQQGYWCLRWRGFALGAAQVPFVHMCDIPCLPGVYAAAALLLQKDQGAVRHV